MSYRISRGDVRKLELTSNASRNVIDISQIYHRISFYEDLLSTYMSCNIDIMDGTSFRTLLPLSGGELVDLDIGEQHEGGDVRDLVARMTVFKMSNKQRATPDIEYYTLNMITLEQMRDLSQSVRTAYHKPIHEIVKNVVETYITPITGKTLVEVEETKGLHSIVATGISPTAFIRQLIREAESLENPSSIYLFYETIEGYHFVTMDYLYKKDPSHVLIRDLAMTSEATDASHLQNAITFINYEDHFDHLNQQINGGMHNTTHCFDVVSKSLQSSTFTPDDIEVSKYRNKTINPTVIERTFSTPTTIRFMFGDNIRGQVGYVTQNDPTTQNTMRRRPEFASRERAVLNQYASIRLTVSIPGNSNIAVGQTVQVILPSASDTVEDRVLNDRLLSGKYLVTAIAHNFDTSGTYATVMELSRPGYEEGGV